jgi:hypothetical protein
LQPFEGFERLQTLPSVAMALELLFDDTIDDLTLGARNHPLANEYRAQVLILVAHPAGGRGDQLIAGDEP